MEPIGADESRHASPPLLDQRPDLPIVNRGDARHRLAGQGRQTGGGKILFQMTRAFGSRNRAGDFGKHQNPPQHHLAQRRPGGHEGSQFLHRFQARLEFHTRKSLSPVKGRALAVEGAVVIHREAALLGQFAGEHAGGER